MRIMFLLMFFLKKRFIVYLLLTIGLYSFYNMFIKINCYLSYLKYMENDVQKKNLDQQIIEPLFLDQSIKHLV